MLLHNTDNANDWVIVGRFGRTHGIKGLIKVISFTDPQENILDYAPWYAFINKQWQPITLDRVETNPKSILVLVKDHHQREQAACLTNVDIAIKQAQLPRLDTGEYYWRQLIGMQVQNKTGVMLGTVSEILPTGSNDVLIVTGDKRHLIPYLLNDIILGIDDEKKLILVDWDEDF